MAIIDPPIKQDFEEDSWKLQATEIIRYLEIENQVLQLKVIELEERIAELESKH